MTKIEYNNTVNFNFQKEIHIYSTDIGIIMKKIKSVDNIKHHLINSFIDEIKRIKLRGGIRCQSSSGLWFNCYNNELVKFKITQISEVIRELYDNPKDRI